MTLIRRDLLRLAAIGVAGVPLMRGRAAGAQATPDASPVISGPGLVISAADALDADPATQWLAVMDEATYGQGHLDGDIRIGWDEMATADTSPDAVASWTAQMRELVAVRGVSPERPVVVYDEGSLFAARGWWQLVYLGSPIPRVLDGGLSAWRDAGGDVVNDGAVIAPLEAPPVGEEGVRYALLATKDEVLSSLDDPDVLVVDARSAGEYGDGHIPGAVNMTYTDNAVMKDVNTYLPAAELRVRYEALGMVEGKRAITYCSTGARGSVAAFAMRLAGFDNVALYAGSWTEWTRDPDAPVER
jgi:thiosulfate/3-mercaptopyruvate sulfurtransferase